MLQGAHTLWRCARWERVPQVLGLFSLSDRPASAYSASDPLKKKKIHHDLQSVQCSRLLGLHRNRFLSTGVLGMVKLNLLPHFCDS